MRTLTTLATFIAAVSLLALSACGSDNKVPNIPLETPVASSTAATAVDTPAATADGSALPKLINVEITDAGDHDHVVFTFDKSVETPHVDFLETSPVGCASGEGVPVAGKAFLAVRFASASAHDEHGSPSVPDTSLAPNLPAVFGAVETCDFEGVVSWALGLDSVLAVDHSTTAGTEHTVDITHP